MHLMTLLAIVIIAASIGALFRGKRELSLMLIIVNIAVFMVSLFAAPHINYSTWGWVQQELGFKATYLLDPSQIWTLITHMYVHADIMHLLFNMLFLFLIGSQLEVRVGKWRFLIIYFIGGMLAALMQAFLYWGPDGISNASVMVGASGAISALMGAMMMLYPRDEIPFFVGPLLLPRVKVWLSVGLWFVLQGVLFISDSGGNVAYGAHIGGFLAGVLLGRATIHLHFDPRQELDEDWSELEELAVTPELQKALREIRAADESDVLGAWLEFFQEHAICPQCGKNPQMKGHKLKCSCGWERRVL